MSVRRVTPWVAAVVCAYACLARGSARADTAAVQTGATVAVDAPGAGGPATGAAPAPAPRASATATATPPPSRPAPVAAAPEPAKKKQPMDGYAFGIQFGIAHVGTGDVDNPTYVRDLNNVSQEQLAAAGLVGGDGCDITDKVCHTEARRGFHLSIPIQLGGTGVGFRVEPYMTLASAARAYGVYTGPTFEFQLAEPFYLGFGFGLKVAWVDDVTWKYAADLYGRIPAHATLYVSKNLALVAEFAFGAGASGYVSELRDITVGGQRIARKSDMTFGLGRTWDVSFGFRFP